MWKWIGKPAVLRRSPERVPVLLTKVGQPEPLRLAGEQHPAVPGSGAALDLAHARVDVPERHRHDRDEATGIGRRPVAKEVVVDLDADELEGVVTDLQELLASETGHVRVEHLRPDAVAVHQFQARVRVVGRGMHVLVRGRRAGKWRGPAGKCRDPRGIDLDSVEQPDVNAGGVSDHVRNVLDIARRDARGPHVTRLGDVRVAVDDVVAHGRLRIPPDVTQSYPQRSGSPTAGSPVTRDLGKLVAPQAVSRRLNGWNPATHPKGSPT
jgi:hypothetical protein